jgi:hypothetical protein
VPGARLAAPALRPPDWDVPRGAEVGARAPLGTSGRRSDGGRRHGPVPRGAVGGQSCDRRKGSGDRPSSRELPDALLGCRDLRVPGDAMVAGAEAVRRAQALEKEYRYLFGSQAAVRSREAEERDREIEGAAALGRASPRSANSWKLSTPSRTAATRPGWSRSTVTSPAAARAALGGDTEVAAEIRCC